MGSAGLAVEHDIVVKLSQEKAFALFVERFSGWWPKEYTWSQGVLETIGIEPKPGGRCTETGPCGFQIDWGRVLEWVPPDRLVFSWQIGVDRVPQPDPAQASEVHIAFAALDADTTRIALTHRGLEHHGAKSVDYRNALASEYGWPFILGRYLDAAHA